LPELEIVSAGEGDIEALVALWELCGLTRPWNDPRADIALALRGPASDILIGRQAGTMVASVMVGVDGHRGWVYYVAVHPELRRTGLGRRLMQAAEAWVAERGTPKIQLMVRGSNRQAAGFYSALGYLQEDIVVFGKRFDGRGGTAAHLPAGATDD
jgi:ribosomal protein S18 acetylase RimI-like enzyme